MRLQGRIAIVTDPSTGIAEAIAEACAAVGARQVINSRSEDNIAYLTGLSPLVDGGWLADGAC